MNPRLAFVIAHYDPQGRVADHLFGLVKHLATLATRVIFVSTGLSPPQAARLAPYARIMSRQNFGYDFWSYKLGIEALGDRSDLDRLVLLNSSFITFDPVRLCQTFLAAPIEPALRGLTASGQLQWHAQSYWVAFEGRPLINSPDFARWWGEMVPISERWEVIRRYELGMSARFASCGVPVRGAFQPSLNEMLIAICRALECGHWKIGEVSRNVALDLEAARQLNPTRYFWDALLERFGVIKFDLVTTNEEFVNISKLSRYIAASPDMLELLRNAVQG